MKKVIFTSLLLFSIHCTKAQTFNANLATMLQDTLSTYCSFITNIKGMAASVYVPGQGTWEGVYGNSYTGQPITSDMKFGIASNTKLFVATTMLMLQEDGILSLDDSISDWLPTYPNVNPNITIRQLLNHTSGVSDPIFFPPWMDTIQANPTRVFTPVEVLSWLGAPLFPAGTSWGYSNVNYILAGMIAESATASHISELIRDSILTPLNMDSTFYDVEELELGIVSHRWWNNIDYNDTSRVGLNSAGGCAGSLFSTTSEMALWYHSLFSGQLLNAASMAELSTFVTTSSATYDYSLGLSRETTQGITYWGHGGSTWGYRSKMIYDTCMGTVVCGLTNCFPSGMEGVTFLLYRVVINHVPGCSGALTGTTTVCQETSGVTYTVPPIPNATSYVWTLPNGATGTSNTNTIVVDYGPGAVSGNIMVSGVNNYGAGGNATLSITVNPTPPTPVITQNVNILTSNAAVGNQWYNSSGIINGETNQSYTVLVTDDYYCIVTLLGCSSDTSNILNVIPTSTHEYFDNATSVVFPNPVSNELTIEFGVKNSEAKIEISNMLGESVYTGTAVNKLTLQMSDFAKGIYILQITNGGTTQYIKLIKE